MDDFENSPWWWRLSGKRWQQQDVIVWCYVYIAVSFAIGFSVNNIFEQYLIAKMSISSSSENRDEIKEDNLVSALISLSSWGNKLQRPARLLYTLIDLHVSRFEDVKAHIPFSIFPLHRNLPFFCWCHDTQRLHYLKTFQYSAYFLLSFRNIGYVKMKDLWISLTLS